MSKDYPCPFCRRWLKKENGLRSHIALCHPDEHKRLYPKTEERTLCLHIPIELFERLESASSEFAIPKYKLVINALLEYLS